ncbi:hypothetical protein Tco_0085326 [Tanacetum coccineum]
MCINEEKNTMKLDKVARYLLIQGLLNDIYSLIDNNKTAKELWDALERQMCGLEYDEQDRLVVVLYEYEILKANDGSDEEYTQGSTRQCTNSEVTKHLGVTRIEHHNGLVEDTTMSTYLLHMSPSSAIRFKTPIDMLGFLVGLLVLSNGCLNRLKKMEIGYNKRRGQTHKEEHKTHCVISNSRGSLKRDKSLYNSSEITSDLSRMKTGHPFLKQKNMTIVNVMMAIVMAGNVVYEGWYGSSTDEGWVKFHVGKCQAVTKNTLKGMKHLGEYWTGWKIKMANVLDFCNEMSTRQCTNSGVTKHLGVTRIEHHNGLVEDTTMSTYLVHMLPSSAIRFKTPIDMLGFLVGLLVLSNGCLNRLRSSAYSWNTIYVEWVIRIGGLVAGSHRYKEDSNEAAFVVDAVENYAHEVCFSATVTGKEMTTAMTLTRSIHQIIRNQSGNTISVLQSRFYNGKFVQTLLEKHFILSLEGFVDFDYDMGSINVMGRSIIKNGFLLQGCAISWEGKDKKDKKKKNQSKTDKKREKSSQE